MNRWATITASLRDGGPAESVTDSVGEVVQLPSPWRMLHGVGRWLTCLTCSASLHAFSHCVRFGIVGIMFKTKRQRRQDALQSWGGDVWKAVDKFLILFHVHFQTGKGSTGATLADRAENGLRLAEDEVFRATAIALWLDKAQDEPSFVVRLDRRLGLATDEEERECDAYWSTRRNKVYVWFAFLAFGISLVSIVVSIIALRR